MIDDTDNSDGTEPETVTDNVSIVDDAIETPDPETVAEPEGEPDKTSPEKMQQLIAENAFKAREAKREAEVAKADLAALRAENAAEAQGERPDIPALPEDSYDPDYARKMAQRDQALQEAAAFDANEKLLQQMQQQAQVHQQESQQRSLNEAANAYQQRGIKSGLTTEQMNHSAQRVLSYPLSQDEQTFLLSEEEGPLIMKYLSDNILELDEFAGQPQTPQRLVKLATDIKAKALAKKVPITETPDPTSEVRSGGVQVEQLGPKGATFM